MKGLSAATSSTVIAEALLPRIQNLLSADIEAATNEALELALEDVSKRLVPRLAEIALELSTHVEYDRHGTQLTIHVRLPEVT